MHEAVFHANAARLYGLPLPAPAADEAPASGGARPR